MVVGSGKRASSGGLGEWVIIIVQALLIAVVVRALFFQPFNIPSGSMKPNLLIGDYLFVSKLSYGYSKYSFSWLPINFDGRVFGAEPKRGDVVVFKLPREPSTDYIKRVIGLPGDEIYVREGIVYINGEMVKRVRDGAFPTFDRNGTARNMPRYRETLPNGVSYWVLDSEVDGQLDNKGPYNVPAGHFFMMGDNRDNSTDSRVLGDVGYVPFQNLVGRAQIIFFSVGNDDEDGYGQTSFFMRIFNIRWGRFFQYVR